MDSRLREYIYSIEFNREGCIRLDVNHTSKFLDSIQQKIALLDCFLVLCILGIRSVRLDDSADLVNHGIDSSSGDESREVADLIR